MSRQASWPRLQADSDGVRPVALRLRSVAVHRALRRRQRPLVHNLEPDRQRLPAHVTRRTRVVRREHALHAPPRQPIVAPVHLDKSRMVR